MSRRTKRSREADKETVLAETSRVAIVKVRPKYKSEEIIILRNKRTGFYTSWNLDEIFDLTELLDDFCDAVEDEVAPLTHISRS